MAAENKKVLGVRAEHGAINPDYPVPRTRITQVDEHFQLPLTPTDYCSIMTL